MIAGGMLRRSFWGRGRGGRGSAPSLAQRSRSRLQFAERQTLAAIVDRNFAGFVLPHQHATLRRRPVLTLPPRPRRFLLAEPPQPLRRGVIGHVHETALRPTLFQPL